MKIVRIALACVTLSLTSVYTTAATAETQWLFVQTATEFTSEETTLTLPFERDVFAFTDRPQRQHAYLNETELVALWETGENHFGENPPNAVLTWVEEGDIREAEIKLTAARVSDQGRSITYQFEFEAGHQLPQKAERVSLFIDGAYETELNFGYI